jgi:hypothetical protein
VSRLHMAERLFLAFVMEVYLNKAQFLQGGARTADGNGPAGRAPTTARSWFDFYLYTRTAVNISLLICAKNKPEPSHIQHCHSHSWGVANISMKAPLKAYS